MKLIRKYFLLLSYAPFLINAGLFILMLLGTAIWGAATSPDGHSLIPIVKKVLVWSAILIIGHTILAYSIRSKYITFDNDEGNYWLLILITNGERVVVEKPVWKKGEKYFLANPYKNGCVLDDSQVCTATCIKGQYKNTTMTMSITLTLRLNKAFDELELFNILHDKFPQKKRLNIKDYIQDVFQKFNVKNQDKINEIMKQYTQKSISEPEMLNQVADNIFFPERLFDNVVDTEICVEKIAFSSCKGMSCGSAKARAL